MRMINSPLRGSSRSLSPPKSRSPCWGIPSLNDSVGNCVDTGQNCIDISADAGEEITTIESTTTEIKEEADFSRFRSKLCLRVDTELESEVKHEHTATSTTISRQQLSSPADLFHRLGCSQRLLMQLDSKELVKSPSLGRKSPLRRISVTSPVGISALTIKSPLRRMSMPSPSHRRRSWLANSPRSSVGPAPTAPTDADDFTPNCADLFPSPCPEAPSAHPTHHGGHAEQGSFSSYERSADSRRSTPTHSPPARSPPRARREPRRPAQPSPIPGWIRSALANP